jgi:hypothetical protein
MVSMVILLLTVGVVATVVTTSYRNTATSQVETQAYYTARTVNERLMNWLTGTPEFAASIETGSPDDFIRSLKADSDRTLTQAYTEADLGEGMGSAEAEIKMDSAGEKITIKVTAKFAGDAHTITSNLVLGDGAIYTIEEFGRLFDASTYDPDVAWGSEVNSLTSYTRDSSPIVVGNEKQGDRAAMTNYNNNVNDTKTASAVTGTRELTWINIDGWNEVAGTAVYPANADATGSDTSPDIRRWVTPPNGRWTLNPLQYASNQGTSSTSQNSATAESNTRISMLSVGNANASDFTGKDLYLRLAGNSGNAPATGDKSYYNALIGLDLTDNKNNTTSNSYVEYYDNNRYANAQSLWHPQNWNSFTMFTQATGQKVIDAGVDTNIVLGPYMHVHRLDTTYKGYGDYWNWGRYIANPWYGQSAGDMNEAFPGNAYHEAYDLARVGMSFIPEYYGNDARFFFLDNSTKKVMFLQGVNVLDQNGGQNSVIYSLRSTELGGGLEKSSNAYADGNGQTTRHVNSNVDGMSYGFAPAYTNYFPVTTRYSQIFYNTDIILRTPSGTSTPRTSRILDATLPNDGTYAENNRLYDFGTYRSYLSEISAEAAVQLKEKKINYFNDPYNQQFSPTVKIIGGNMFVGAGQTLNIDGGRINPKNNEKTLTVSPDAITIEAGATVNIRGRVRTGDELDGKYSDGDYVGAAAYPAVTTDIYVGGALNLLVGSQSQGNIIVSSGGALTIAGGSAYFGNIYVQHGGTLTIEKNAVINGDIYCAGTLNLKGSFTLNAPADLADNPDTAEIDESNPENHGVFLFNSEVAGTATLVIADKNMTISGTSGKVHAFGGYTEIVDEGNLDKTSGIFCDKEFGKGRDTEDNTCLHWTGTGRYWTRE